MQASPPLSQRDPVVLHRAHGQGALLLLCEHASAHIPPHYAGLGLSPADRERHIAWDLGALDLSLALSALLDVPLVAATHSRLLIDLNRDPNAADSIVLSSEDTRIPGNQDLSLAERRLRRQWLYEPFHNAVDQLIDTRLGAGQSTAVLSIHSFTPRYRGVLRPWHAGVIAQRDLRLGTALLKGLRQDPALTVGDNEPYGPHDGVYHSAERHGEQRGLPCAMLEVRHDLLATPEGVRAWAERLAEVIRIQWLEPQPA